MSWCPQGRYPARAEDARLHHDRCSTLQIQSSLWQPIDYCGFISLAPTAKQKPKLARTARLQQLAQLAFTGYQGHISHCDLGKGIKHKTSNTNDCC
jgi:hypothetical protein